MGKITYIDLFAGAGGFSLGLMNAGFRGLFAVEKNIDAFNTLKRNLIVNNNHFDWPEWLPILNHDIEQVINKYGKELHEITNVDLVVGGPPCQGFSMAGKRMEDDLRNQLSEQYIKFVSIILPKFILFENVTGFTYKFSKDEKSYSVKVIKELEELGYAVQTQIIDFSDYGVPQKRKRFILFGSLSGNFDFFELLERVSKEFLVTNNLKKKVFIQNAIDDLAIRKRSDVFYKNNHGFGKYSNANTDYQRFMRKDSDLLQPDSHRFIKHRAETVSRLKTIMKITGQEQRVLTKLERSRIGTKKHVVTSLKVDNICPTITSIPDDYIHYSNARSFTPREMARIQSFPDWFVFTGKYTTGGQARKTEVPRYTQIANAVPPLFATQLGETLKRVIT